MMLNKSPHFADALSDAQTAARSMSGNCVEMIDILTRLQGADMRDLASLMPFEFAALHHHLAEARDAALAVDLCRKEVSRSACDV